MGSFLKTTKIFISYHPGSLVEYDYLSQLDNKKSSSVLIICRHPYLTEEMVSVYSKRFDHVIILPDIDYDINIIRGLVCYHKFIKYFKKEIDPILQRIDTFDIISDCSAYLPVNALISTLKKDTKCKKLISIRENTDLKKKPWLLSTIRTRFYTTLLRLYKVQNYKVLNYLYAKDPCDVAIMLLSPFERDKFGKKEYADVVPVHVIYKSIPDKKSLNKNIIIFYSDRNLEGYYTDLSRGEHSQRIKGFLRKLSEHYKDCRIICKTHPLDQRKPIDEMQEIEAEIYNGSLTSQMHIDMNVSAIRACYSIASTSLFYAASMGIPSYTAYKYLGYNSRYPEEFFKNDRSAQNRFLYHIGSLDEIGKIDDINVEPVRSSNIKDWDQIMYSNNA